MTRRRFTQLLMATAMSSRASFAKSEPNPEIRRAMEAVMAAIPKAESDPDRPVYHLHPPANWNNDPNGTIWYKGWYHLFYQHNPYAAVWGHMHWGHARSRDLVNWEHLPIALWPSVEKGEEHVFSGGAALAADGRPRLFYTSIGKRDPEQWMAMPADDELIVWEKYARNPVVTLKIHGDRKVDSWRDPFLFREAGKTYMVCGGNLNERQGGAGAVQLYEATNRELTGWKYRGVVFEDPDRDVINVECPNLLRMGTKWVLLIAPHKAIKYFVGDLDLTGAKFVAEAYGVLDPGTSYATNVLFDDKSEDGKPRCILWMWARTATDPEKGWNGAMTIPRVLTIGDDGYLRQNPAPELRSLRGEVQTFATTPLMAGKPLVFDTISGDCMEIQADFTAESAATGVGLRIRRPAAGGGTEIAFDPKNGMLTVAGIKKLVGVKPWIRIRAFLDKRVLEVFGDNGTAAIYTTIDAGPRDLGVEVFALGGRASLDSLKVWPLKPARLSLERFRV